MKTEDTAEKIPFIIVTTVFVLLVFLKMPVKRDNLDSTGFKQRQVCDVRSVVRVDEDFEVRPELEAVLMQITGSDGRLDKLWHNYALMHEISHVARGHIDDPAFALHQDKGIFTQPVDSRTIPRHELEANLISAEYSIDTNSVLCLIGYDNSTMRDYRSLKKHQAQLTQAYNALRFSTDVNHSSNSVKYRMAEYRRALMALDEKRQDLESDMTAMNCVLSLSEIAHEVGTTDTILKYKLEAMRIRGYDIDIQELERYDRVFLDAK